MKVVQCPDRASWSVFKTYVFVAGGISNCPNWQKEMIARFTDLDDRFIMINPRRDNFDMTKQSESEFQIEWEFDHINSCDAMIFWFPYHTLCPITLYELGRAAADPDIDLFVGCHPAYERKFDVEKQLSLIRPDVRVRDNFDDLVNDVKAWYR